ncbi:hypothetical protein [Hoeflea ulvae]|uniref:Type II secretion system protein GspH n=1 Tax=Hoeflea ulvae TaxID=2983764 RepID=A0ABT3YH34_9HYPH|nr:hypothetical protein [Hoeflea ulvae]MCY0095206.1 hypothetical protein [Hoeflea ulvae]
MSLGVLVVVVAFGVILIIGAVHYSGGSTQKDARDHGEVILEFARAYPGEAIRSVSMTKDGRASFLRLADGKTGFMQAMGRHFVARLILPGSASVEPLEDQPGLRIAFHDSTLQGGDYVFNSTDEAAEVSLWLCDSFALASPKLDEPGEGGNA